jgi:hypothetical protein
VIRGAAQACIKAVNEIKEQPVKSRERPRHASLAAHLRLARY